MGPSEALSNVPIKPIRTFLGPFWALLRDLNFSMEIMWGDSKNHVFRGYLSQFVGGLTMSPPFQGLQTKGFRPVSR